MHFIKTHVSIKIMHYINTSVLKIPFLVGPGRYGFQRAGTRVLAPMGDNR